jgi:V8-like Glu-specific endopeptidase
MDGKLNRIESNKLFYDIDTTPGQSGSSVCKLDENNVQICIGVHTDGRAADPKKKHNSGTYIFPELLAAIESWKSS